MQLNTDIMSDVRVAGVRLNLQQYANHVKSSEEPSY